MPFQIKRLIPGAAFAVLSCVAAAVPSRLDTFHAPLARIYSNYVRQESRIAANKPYLRSVVKYSLLKSNAAWAEYVRQLAYVDAIALETASADAQKAFWINAYNSFVMNGVIVNFPLPAFTINEYPAGSFRGSAGWSAPLYAAGSSYTLESIRKRLSGFRDPRVFLAINDGAISSPALPDEPYDATNVEMLLERMTTNFLNDPLNFRIDRTRNKIVLSELFRANAPIFRDATAFTSPDVAKYPADARAILTFLLPRISRDNVEYIIRRKPMIEYGTFDWTLNLVP